MEELKEGWRRVKLSEVAEYISNKINTSELNENNYISTENMIVNRGGVTKATNIPQNAKVNCFSENDILFSNIRTYFKKLWKADFNGGASNDVLIIRSLNSKNILNDYLYYIMSKEKFFDYTVNTSKGTKMPRGDKAAIMQYEFYIPEDIKVQQKIASILSALDDKIELNNEMNKTLEEMAQTLFKRWFIDFDFPNENGEPYRSSGGKMVDSELGEIPEGWEVKKLGEVIDVVDYVANGSFKSLKDNVTLYDDPNEILYVRTTDYNNEFSKNLKYTDKKSYKFLKKSKLYGEEVIISNVGDVGTVFRPPSWLGLPMTLGSNAVALTFKEYSYYIYYYFKSRKGQHSIESITTGSAQLKFNKTSLRGLNILIPNQEMLKEFKTIENIIFNKINIIKGEIKSLTETRDTLLPKLMSGEVEV